jgi:Na+/proline symporter
MGLGVSIFLIAVGAVLAFAIHVSTNGVDLHTIGYILMGAGALGIVLSLIFWSSWGGPGGVRRTTDVRTVDDRPL